MIMKISYIPLALQEAIFNKRLASTLKCRRWLIGLLGGLLLSSSLFADTGKKYNNPIDPYERWNRAVFAFNEAVDKSIVRPLATLYNKIMPKPLNKGVSNFFNNIDTIPTVANDLLQANFYQATNDSWRLGINSTVGILGFFDFATDMGLEPNSEDFGLTLAQWGYRNSNYLVIPFLGPSTLRDGISFFINYHFLTIYPYIYPVNDRYRLYLFGVLQRRAELVRFQSVLEQAAVDKYIFMRDAYMQRRSYQIQRNKELSDPYLSNEDDSNGSSRAV
jgi:phospholipid-binding lipoprotein MlaA